jgi:flagellar hook-associated protein 2
MSTSNIAATAYTTAVGTTTGATTSAATATMSADVAAKVQSALAPAAAAATKLNTALTGGQTRLSGLGQVQSAIADFQATAKTLSASGSTAGAGTAADITSKLKAFVDGFNTLNGKLQALQKADLKADPGLTQVTSQLAQVVRNAGAALAKAGISLDTSGNMKIDAGKLSTALSNDPAAVAKLLSHSGGGVVDQVANKLAAMTTLNGPIGREAASATKTVSALETKKTALTKTLTVQATALAALYTQQAQSQTGTPTSLFDMLA